MADAAERKRLHVLELYDIMDSTARETLDGLVRLAARICGTEMSLISMVGEEQQEFRAAYGTDLEQTPREHSFCQHLLGSRDVMTIDDAREAALFRDNPLVTGEPHIRFYAGAPLEVEPGIVLGTLCVLDTSPKTLDAGQRESLEVLRDCVVTQLRYQRARAEMHALEHVMPFCAWCRRIRVEARDGNIEWKSTEDFVQEREPVTHGICPDCAEQQLE